jgi:hypothetical protein
MHVPSEIFTTTSHTEPGKPPRPRRVIIIIIITLSLVSPGPWVITDITALNPPDTATKVPGKKSPLAKPEYHYPDLPVPSPQSQIPNPTSPGSKGGLRISRAHRTRNVRRSDESPDRHHGWL